MKCIIASVAAFASIAFFFSRYSCADDFFRPIHIGLSATGAPYVLSLRDQSGISAEIIKAVADKAGWKVRFSYMPLNRHTKGWGDLGIDAISLWNKPTALSCYVTKPYRYWRDGLFVIEDKINDWPKAVGLRLGVFRGARNLIQELQSPPLSRQEIIEVATVETAVLMLRYRRLEAYIGDSVSVQYYVNHTKDRGGHNIRLAKLYEPLPQYLCFQEKALARAFDESLASLISQPDQPLKAIAQKYGVDIEIVPSIHR